MRKISNWVLITILTLSSCTQEFNYDPSEEIMTNAETIFGIIDSNQDWRTTTSGSITVTANANLDNIAKVQILTESPFFNDQAKILAEANVTKGETVTLSYDAPRENTRLIAACIDNNGKYFIKGFNMAEERVSFSSSTPATTRGLGATRATADLPDLSAVKFEFSQSFKSYNALRTEKPTDFPNWTGKNWDEDRIWWPTGTVSSNGWTMTNSTIYKNATALSDDEAATLKDIFDASLARYNNNKPRDNIKFINASSAVQLYGNHLVSNGKAALTMCPVQLASTEAYWCDIYYYYYRTEDIPAGTTEADYIKTLPKFKAIDLNDEREAFSASTGIAINASDVNFRRLHEYLLPFYGNASEFALKTVQATLGSNGYITDEKLYRIKNYSDGAFHYITNGGENDDLKGAYTQNVEEQLWQIFENPAKGTFMFYNVASRKFLWCNNGRPVIKDINEKSLDKFTFYITDSGINPTESRTRAYIYTYNQNKCIKSDGGTRLGVGDKSSTNEYREWTFEEYNASTTATPITDFALPSNLYPSSRIAKPTATPTAIIPEGYRIGFMIRKDNGDKTSSVKNDKHGCLYGYGELNTEINTYGQFKTAVKSHGMQLNSPRIATFTANDRIYLCFEEGADAQYSDVIVEIGSEGETGVYMFDDVQEVNNLPFTMCFEDRPNVADYDMNDVVLRCVRKSPTQLELSLIATGAQDQVYIEGVDGTFISGTDINNKEVHTLFGVANSTYVNTQSSDAVVNAISGVYEVSESTTIPQFLTNIYIRNYSQAGNEIHVPKKGQPPFALIVPGDFNYPIEQVSIVNAYTAFSTWATNAYNYGAWMNSFNSSKIYTNPYNR